MGRSSFRFLLLAGASAAALSRSAHPQRRPAAFASRQQSATGQGFFLRRRRHQRLRPRLHVLEPRQHHQFRRPQQRVERLADRARHLRHDDGRRLRLAASCAAERAGARPRHIVGQPEPGAGFSPPPTIPTRSTIGCGSACRPARPMAAPPKPRPASAARSMAPAPRSALSPSRRRWASRSMTGCPSASASRSRTSRST